MCGDLQPPQFLDTEADNYEELFYLKMQWWIMMQSFSCLKTWTWIVMQTIFSLWRLC